MRYKITKEEREIINMLPKDKIEIWANEKRFWKIYHEIIKATKKYLKQQKPKPIFDKEGILLGFK